jgi:hypothetical protein
MALEMTEPLADSLCRGMRAQATNSSHNMNHQKQKKTNMTKHLPNSVKIEALRTAILAALNGTGETSTALSTVRKVFTKTIHGVRVLAKEPEPAWLSNN